ncbi:hypothetical protein ACQPZG_13280 [Streptomyces sp. CA-294286]
MTTAESSDDAGPVEMTLLSVFLFLVLVVAGVIFLFHKLRGRK